LHRLGKEGFHVIAIDLPGYGFSEGIQLDIRESAIFMKELIVLFKLQKIILVSPSTSIKVRIFDFHLTLANLMTHSYEAPVGPNFSTKSHRRRFVM